VRAIECTSEQAVDDAHAQALARFRQDDGGYQIDASQIRLVAAP
jgi:hypothetical protein